MNKKRLIVFAMVSVILATLPISMVYSQINYVDIGDSKYEKWEKTDTIDTNELNKEVKELKTEFSQFQKDKKEYIGACITDCEMLCESNYEMQLNDLEQKITRLEEKIKEVTK